ncbi:MAG TPA: ROK family protein [Verrucomicrobiales bacterium]|nr:ROK family protein [Verrucomicrobiales bacterium]
MKFFPDSRNRPFFGAIEAGGTKFLCATGPDPNEITASERIATAAPAETLAQAVRFFRATQESHGPLRALGVVSFGPIDLRRNSPTFGHLTTTPKEGWRGFDLIGTLRRELSLPVAFDTDVNGAALAEWKWGAGRGGRSCLYITVGTGIGGGFVLDGRSLQGLFHPEMGHLLLRRDHRQDPFEGICPYHRDCLEGLASGPALSSRWKTEPRNLPSDHPAWPLEAEYLGQAVTQWILTLSPEIIVLGGGVMKQLHLFPLIRRKVRALLNGYLPLPQILDLPESYIRPPDLGDRSGIAGAFALAAELTAIPPPS